MIFDTYHIELIARGKKTQTRRVVKAGETEGWDGYVRSINEVYTRRLLKLATEDTPLETYRLKWQVGRDYAVCPGRGKPCAVVNGKPLRIRITGIRREKLNDISPDDVRAEGVRHDQDVDPLDIGFDEWEEELRIYRDIWNDINTRKGTRWQDNPDVWVLEFEAVQR